MSKSGSRSQIRSRTKKTAPAPAPAKEGGSGSGNSVNMVQNRLVLIINFFESLKWKILEYGAGAAWSRLFLPGAEPTQVCRSRSRLRDLGYQEPEPPNKVAAPQHWSAYKNKLKSGSGLITNDTYPPSQNRTVRNLLTRFSQVKIISNGNCVEQSSSLFLS